MDQNNLDISIFNISPLDGRYADKTYELRGLWSEFALIKHRVIIEVKWLLFLASEPEIKEVNIKQSDIEQLKNIYTNFSTKDALKVKEIEKNTNHDVKAIEYFLKQKIQSNARLHDITEFIHFACTSEDINNLSYALMLKNTINEIINLNLSILLQKIVTHAKNYKTVAMLAKTHGQPASPTTLGKEFANVAYRLHKQILDLNKIKINGKINGAVGNYNAHLIAYPKFNWFAFTEKFVHSLKLDWIPYTTQIEPHDYIAEIMHSIQRINNILLDFNKDIWSYISSGIFRQKAIKNEIGSSTMPHKINPIDFENSEGNLGIANSLANHFANKLPISRLQRDLTDSTVLRNLGLVFGYSLLAYKSTLKGLDKLEINHKVVIKELEENWIILAEPIQTIMRKHKIPNSYEKLKNLTRGEKITKTKLQKFINSLEIPIADKKRLLKLTPSAYIGNAISATENFELVLATMK